MGFIVSGSSIFIGAVIGSFFGKRVNIKDYSAIAIGIMLMSLVGLLENILSISDGQIIGEHTVIVTLALIVGCTVGDVLKMEDRLYSLSNTQSLKSNGLIESFLFFGIGGLQVSGPIVYALKGESFQLILKGVIDFPFALMLGATYGKRVSLAAPMVVAMQILTAISVRLVGDFLSNQLVPQLCSFGYLILFFSGFNMICSPQNKIRNINMLPGVFLLLLYNVLAEVLSR